MNSSNTPEGRSTPEFLNALLENLVEGVVACDANGILTHFNRTAREIHGLPDLPLPASEWARHYNLYREDGVTLLTMEEVPLYRAFSGEVIRDVELIVKTASLTRVVVCNGHPVFDENGKKLGAVATVHDITAAKAAAVAQHRALAESEKRFRTLFEQSPLSIQRLSVDGRTLQVNEAWKKLWKADDIFVNEFILKEYRILEDPQLVEKGIMPYLKAGFAGRGTKIPAINYVPSEFAAIGRARWVEGLVEPIFDENGAVQEVVLIHQDVTDKIEFEIELKSARDAAEESNRLKTSFLANMSHEIRTPLGAVLGFAELLKDRTLPIDEAEEYLRIIERSGRGLMQIIDDILDLSKVEAGRLRLEVTPTDLNALLNEIAALFKVQTTERNLRLVVEPLPSSSALVKTDSTRLRQILINLVGNAVKFTPQGEVRVLSEVKDEQIRISVSDSGIGIEPELQAHLFQPFSQLDDSRTRRFGGTGLGLALSRRLAQALSGDVVLAKSQIGIGSTFKVTLPYHPAESEESSSTLLNEPIQNSGPQALAGLKILLVDDSDDNRHFVGRLLVKRGASLAEATNGAEALSRKTAGDFDLIIMDVQMPLMDGNEATRQLRASGDTTPIIALTAHAMAEERDRCLAAGANAHVTKPVQIDLLVNTIVKLTEARRKAGNRGQ